MLGQAPITELNPTASEMEVRVARFRSLGPTADYAQDPGMINWPSQVRAAAAAVGVTLP